MEKRVFLWAFAILAPASVWASAGPMERTGRREPPQEAIDACKGKSEGASVEIVTPRGDTIEATCKQINGHLTALPDKGSPVPVSDGPPPGAETER